MNKEVLKMLTEKKSNSNLVTVECLLAFDKDEDKERVLSTVRKFSSMVRFAYKRLLHGAERKELKKLLSRKYGINTRYSGDAILLAQQNLDSCVERGQNPKKLVFGSRELFERVILTRDWVGAAKQNGLVPLPGQGTTVLNRYSFV